MLTIWLNTDESEKLGFHLNIDGKDTKLEIDFSKVNLYDEVEIEIEREAGSTLGRYILSAKKVTVGGNNGSGSNGNNGGSSTEKNPNTGAEDIVGVVSAMAVVSAAAAAALVLRKRK